MEQEILNILIEELLKWGEDKNELELWKNLFPTMGLIEQRKLIKNLEDELQQLKSLK